LPETVSQAKTCLPGRKPGRHLLSLDLLELEQIILGLGHPRFRAHQIFQWLHGKGAFRAEEMRNLPRALRQSVEGLESPFPLIAEGGVRGEDGAEKFRFRLLDGGVIESVLIPEENRLTLCVSTQLGCRMGCVFCRTAGMGFKRDLATEEILAQVYWVRSAPGRRLPLSHIVLMGMGEPLDNLENTVQALRILTHPLGSAFSTRRVTVSTVGIPDRLEALYREVPVSLTLSLNAPDSRTRNRLMPVNRRHPVEEVLRVLRGLPLPPRRRITVAYVMVKGVNDRPGDARELCRLLHGLRCKVNLIPLNPFPGLGLERPEEREILEFQSLLRARGISTHVRFSRGADILAACGQLASSPAPGEAAGDAGSAGDEPAGRRARGRSGKGPVRGSPREKASP
jgi:23S rRNA (adenine2503-C2)-methyltransferase